MRRRSLILCVFVLLPAAARAAGFAIDYESARAVGFATAGGAAAEDASTIFYNPAGMSFLQGDQFIGGGQLFLLHDNFTNTGSTFLGGALPTPGTNGRQAFPVTPVPWFYASHTVNDQLSIGVGVFAPFGLKDDYGPQFVGRYQSQLAALTVADLNPAIAYRPLPWLSLGGGGSLEYADVELTQAIDFGSLCTITIGAGQCAAAFGLKPGQSDGRAKLTANGFAFGYNLGALIEPQAGTRLGVAYRSGTAYNFSGAKQSFEVPAGARAFLTAGGLPLAFTGGEASVGLPLPGRLSFAAKQAVSADVELVFDATLTFWDVFKTTVIAPANPATGVGAVINDNFRDAWRFALGAAYKMSPDWTLRGGVSYDQSPIPRASEQAIFPDRDRLYLSFGVSYRLTRSVSVDLGFSHAAYLGSVPIDRMSPAVDRLLGHFNAGGEILAAQVRVEY